MKKILLYGGLVVAGYGLYRMFTDPTTATTSAGTFSVTNSTGIYVIAGGAAAAAGYFL